jgi:hypothetical protein
MGKSTCCKSLLADLQYYFPIVSVCSGSEKDNPFYGKMIPKLFIHSRITPRFLKQIISPARSVPPLLPDTDRADPTGSASPSPTTCR